jgi:hypothetical protein
MFIPATQKYCLGVFVGVWKRMRNEARRQYRLVVKSMALGTKHPGGNLLVPASKVNHLTPCFFFYKVRIIVWLYGHILCVRMNRE